MSSQIKKNQSSLSSIGVFAIIFDDNRKVLLCHRRDYDLWNLPGGKLRKKEAPWEGVIREVKEETNLDVKVDKLLGVYYKPDQSEIVFNFLCSIFSGKIRLTDEADDIKFFSYLDIPCNTSTKQKERIVDAYENSKNLLLKTQKGLDSIESIKKASIHSSR